MDKANLEAWRNAPIEMSDTPYGCYEAQQKRDAEHDYQKISRTEKELFRQKMAGINEADVGNGQSPPTSPTPV